MKVLYFMVWFALCGTLTACNPNNLAGTKWGIWVENRSDKDVYFLVGLDLLDDKYYPTTNWPNDSTKLFLVSASRHTATDYSARKVKCSPGAPIAIFVLSPDSVAKYSWTQLGSDENYLKKYEFTCGSIPRELVYP
ncbi:hypothetical protein LJC45_00895 [Alistipes sp. OttesenSCG-928-B03]|nr:hypothetical protein [Alistipes sp. OttesenSCG-928-B03]